LPLSSFSEIGVVRRFRGVILSELVGAVPAEDLFTFGASEVVVVHIVHIATAAGPAASNRWGDRYFVYERMRASGGDDGRVFCKVAFFRFGSRGVLSVQ